VVRGFFGEIISKIAVPEIRDRLTAAIEHEWKSRNREQQPHDDFGNQRPARQRRDSNAAMGARDPILNGVTSP